MSASFASAVDHRAGTPDDVSAYRKWIAEHDGTDLPGNRAIACRERRFILLAAIGDTTAEAIGVTAESLAGQTHPEWELVLSGTLHAHWPQQAIERLCAANPQVRLTAPPSGDNRVAACVDTGSAAFVCLLEPGDTLAPTALQEVAAAFAARPETELLYTDEDVAAADGRRAPRFKGAFSRDLMIAGNFIGQLAVYRSALFSRAARTLDEGSPLLAYEMATAAAACVSDAQIAHLPAVLCHRAQTPVDWPLPAAVARPPMPDLADIWQDEWPRARFALPATLPLVSIIVATRDRADLLEACLTGLRERTDYRAFEIVIVDNGSQDAAAVALLQRLETDGTARVLRRPGPFNFAALNNAAAKEARGEILVLLNNDTEALRADWLSVLVSHAVRPGVGAVGAKLLYPDGTVQHAGMLLGPGGTATHVGRHAPADAPGYDGQLVCTRDLSAVTGACLAIPRAVFDAVGGLDERLEVTWNDVDLCLKVRAASLRVVWTPEAVLLHREAASRGTEADDPAKLQRFERERALMRSKWGAVFDKDPYLNGNLLAHDDGRMILARPRHGREVQ